MAKVTKLSTQKRAGYYNVFVNNEFLCGITESDLIRLGLRKGLELSEQAVEEIQNISVASKHYTAALKYLSYRIRSTREVQDHFRRKKLEPEEIQSIVDQLTQEAYLNDRDFAERWVAMRRSDGRSMRAIQAELMKKGIGRRLIEEFCVPDQDEELVQAIELVEKKRRIGKDDRLIQQFLARRGFSYSTASRALNANQDDR